MNKIKEKIIDLRNNISTISVSVEFYYFLSVLFLYLILGVIGHFVAGSLFLPDSNVVWFWSGLVTLIFSLYYIEPYFTAPTNVFANSFALFLTLLSIGSDSFGSFFWWEASLIILFLMICFSLVTKALYDKNKSDDFIINIISNKIKTVLELIGSGKVLYSLVFIYFLFTNIFSNSIMFSNWQLFYLLLFFCFVLIISPSKIKSFLEKYFDEKAKDKSNNVGKIFAVQSDNVFLVRLFDNRKIEKFTQVYFLHKITEDDKSNVSLGFLFDIYYLDNQKWGKIVKTRTINSSSDEYRSFISKKPDLDYVYLVDKAADEVQRFTGVVNENSTINKLYFEYSQSNQVLEIDDLVEVFVRGKKVFYQVLNASTNVEKLESYNEKGSIVGEAIQLGCWDAISTSFNKIGWIPLVNEAVYVADTKSEENKLSQIKQGEFRSGFIPKTKLPGVITLKDAISHHMAILGVTGSGKSVFARKIIKEIIQDTKVICVDFTGEYIDKLSELKPALLIDKNGLNTVEETLAKKESEQSKGRSANKEDILKFKKEINNKLDQYIKSFIESDNNLSIFELPELSNTTFILEFTQFFLESVFNYAKSNPGQKICIVLEEAHTIVPETNFLGEPGDYGSSKNLVNKMSQIALQGRKYGVGLLVIGQRSANISKTVLTQCNTIVAFRAFDDTSYGFLTNYFGKEIIGVIPNLKNYHAVVYGKGIKSNNPIIIDTYDEREDTSKGKN